MVAIQVNILLVSSERRKFTTVVRFDSLKVVTVKFRPCSVVSIIIIIIIIIITITIIICIGTDKTKGII